MTATSSYGYGRYNVCNEWMEFAKARIPLLQATSRIDRSEPHSTLQMHLLALRDVELYIRRHMNIAAPINRLPDELLARIMALAVRSHVEHAGKVTQYCPPLNFVRVSRRWRWVVSTFPNIWSAPRLSLGKEAFAVMLSKAKAALLHLSWGEHDCANYAYLDDTISLHVLAQAKTISLVGEPQHISEVLARFTHSAPVLYELQIQNTRRMRSYDSLWPHEIFCGSTPRLASLTLVDIAVPIWASSIFCNSLRRIEVSCNTRNAWVYRISSDEYKGASFHNLLNALGRMVHAEHISFKECISFSLAVSESRPSQSISLPHLRTLTIEDRISSCVRFLAHVKIPSRCTIRMRSSWLSDVPFDTVCDVGALARSLPRDMPATRLSIRCRTIPSLLDCRAEMVFTLRDISHGVLFILHLTDVPLDTTAQQHALCAISSALPLRSIRVLCTSFLLPFSADMWLSSFSAARDLRTITLADSQISDLARLLRDRKADAFPRLCALRCTDRLSIRSELALRPRLAARRSNGRFIILGKRASDAKCSSTQVMVVDAIGQVSRLRLKQ